VHRVSPFAAVRAALLLSAAALQGCGEAVDGVAEHASAQSAGYAIVHDFAKRLPDEVLEQPGSLIPDSMVQWGPAGLAGWSDYTTHDAAGRPGVWAKRTEAVLDLPVTVLRDRQIELIAWIAAPPAGAEPTQRVSVELNGRSLGTIVVGPEPSDQRLEAPRSWWRKGGNELLLRVPELRKGWNQETLGIGIARVEYGHSRKVRRAKPGPGLVLEPHTRVRYRLEGVRDQQLVVQGRTSAKDGGLVITQRHFDALTVQSTLVGEPSQLAAHDGRLATRITLPNSNTKILELELEWLAEDGSGTEFMIETLATESRTPQRRPPVILISLDTVGARHSSVYGYPRRTTPRLEEFAAEAVVFERCLANSTWTLPSHMSLMTGLYPAVHALQPANDASASPDLWESWQLDERRWTLAESLRAAGYATAGFVDCLWLSERLHFTQGFDTYDLSAAEIPLGQSNGGIEHVTALAQDWLDRRDERPPFLFLHCFDAHGPYTPPAPWKGQLAGKTLQQPVSSAYAGALDRCFGGIHDYIAAPYAANDGLPPRLPTDPIADAYDEGLLALDARLGRFFDDLRSTSLWDEALVIVTADHGESMTAHDFYFAHGMAFDDVLHVPLIVKLPLGAHGGERVREGVQLVDLYPTLIDYAGLDPTHRGRHGRSLRPAIEGLGFPPVPLLAHGGLMTQAVVEYDRWKLWRYNPTSEADLAVMLTYPGLSREWRDQHVPELKDSALTQALYAAIQADPERFDKLWVGVHEQIGREFEELYDMRLDVEERTNLFESRPEIVANLWAAFARETGRISDTKARLSTPIRSPQLPAADRAALESLGYSGRR
jgi:arylsulfatase